VFLPGALLDPDRLERRRYVTLPSPTLRIIFQSFIRQLAKLLHPELLGVRHLKCEIGTQQALRPPRATKPDVDSTRVGNSCLMTGCQNLRERRNPRPAVCKDCSADEGPLGHHTVALGNLGAPNIDPQPKSRSCPPLSPRQLSCRRTTGGGSGGFEAADLRTP